jgi:hypothetical protein
VTREERAQVIRGNVRHQGNWVPLARKTELQIERGKKIAAGLVEYNGGWVTIDQKMTLLGLKPSTPAAGPQVVINQVYNIHHDTRHEHRHLHVSGNPMGITGGDGERPILPEDVSRDRLAAPDRRALPPGETPAELLP